MLKRNLANLLTFFRMLGSLALALVKPFGVPFYMIYTLCGISDGLDGTVARRLGSADERGALLDSFADILFYAVMIYRLVPTLWNRLPIWVWVCAFVALGLRLTSYATAGVRYRRFASLHTWANKGTGFSIFVLPYLLLIGLPPAVACTSVIAVATLASLEELLIHLLQKRYDPSIHSLFMLLRRNPPADS